MKRRLLFFLLISVLPLGAEGLDKSDYYGEFKRIMAEEDWAYGEKLYRQAVSEYPEELIFRSYLNEMLRRQKKNKEALEQILPIYNDRRESTYLRDSYKWSLIEYGLEMRDDGKLDDALNMLRRAHETDDEDLTAILWYGILLREIGRYEASIEMLEYGEALHDNHYITSNLIHSYVEQANQIRPENPDEAERLYRKALLLDSENLTVLLWYGIFLREQGQYGDALEYLRKAELLYPGNEYLGPNINHTYYEYGRYWKEKGDIEKTAEVYEDAVREFPENLYYYYELFSIYLDLGLTGDAEEILLRWFEGKQNLGLGAHEIFEEENNINHRLEELTKKYIGAGNIKAAFALLDRITPYFTYRHFALHREGELHWLAGERDRGIELINRAYDMFIQDHKEYTRPVTVEMPLKGTFVVAEGNNSPRTMTHAGLSRYCFDFMGSDEEGNTLREGVDGLGRNEDYFGFGMPIFSPVDGTVVKVVDDARDHPPTRDWTYHLEGNHITIEDANNYKYIFVHNKHGSAAVEEGDVVKAGQKIAELGNTSSTVPHLHFGVWTENWTVSIPVRFREYTELTEEGGTVLRTDTTPERGTVIRIY